MAIEWTTWDEYEVSSHQQISIVYLTPFKSIENFARQLVQKCLLYRTPVTLNHGQLDQYKNAEYNSIYHDAKLESNPFSYI